MGKVIEIAPRAKKREKEPLFLGHDCANFLFKLRDDGLIICDKCETPIGYWSLYDNYRPERPDR